MSVMVFDPHRFWMVSGDGPASYRHLSQASAEEEAQRLARLHPGRAFFVMEAIAVHRKVDVERRDLRGDVPKNDDEIPF